MVSNSLPIATHPPQVVDKTAKSLPVEGGTNASMLRTHHAQPQNSSDGPVLHVTVVGASFKRNGAYFLTLVSCGSRQQTPVCQKFEREEHFAFPLGDTDLDLELFISATRVRAAMPASPQCVIPSHWYDAESASGWDEEVGKATLRLSELLSAPQPSLSAPQ